MAGGESPRPGIYRCKITEISEGPSKGDDGKPDPQRRRLEIIYQVIEGEYKNSQLWQYISTTSEGHISTMDQFLLAVDIATKKRKGQFSTEKLIGKIVKVLVKSDKNLDGEYRGKVGKVMADTGPEDADDTEVETEEVEAEEAVEGEVEGDDMDDMDAEETPASVFYDEATLMAMTVPELRLAAAEFDLVIKGMKRPEVVAAILGAQASGEDEEPF